MKGQVALVTRAGLGIGRGIALALAQDGATIVASDLHRSLTEAVARTVEERGVRHSP